LGNCDYDFKQVETKVRSMYKRRTNIAGGMKPYHSMMEERVDGDSGFNLSNLLVKLS